MEQYDNMTIKPEIRSRDFSTKILFGVLSFWATFLPFDKKSVKYDFSNFYVKSLKNRLSDEMKTTFHLKTKFLLDLGKYQRH